MAEWRDSFDTEALLEHADRALMLAKRTGKGRVAVANADVERELALLHDDPSSPAAVQALAAAIEERDSYTREHSEQVVHLARGVAMILGMPAATVDRIAHAALLHDVGKLGIPHEILHKEGPLTAEEWAVMSEHPVAGERILLRVPELAPIAPIVRHEHEHWNGSGYPDGLRGRAIPIGARVILACDAYKAMSTPRPYRPAMTREAAVAELRAGAGVTFDPEVIDALLDLLGETPPQVPDRSAGVRLPPPPPTPRAAAARVALQPETRSGFFALLGLRLLVRDRVGHERRRVGEPRLVEAAVLGQGADGRLRRLAVGVVAGVERAAGAPRAAVVDQRAERGRPGRDGEGDDVALLDRQRAIERELHGLPEVVAEREDRAGGEDAPEQALAAADDAQAGRGLAEVVLEELDLALVGRAEADGEGDDPCRPPGRRRRRGCRPPWPGSRSCARPPGTGWPGTWERPRWRPGRPR